MMLESREVALKQGVAASGSSTVENANVGKDLAMCVCVLKIVFKHGHACFAGVP